MRIIHKNICLYRSSNLCFHWYGRKFHTVCVVAQAVHAISINLELDGISLQKCERAMGSVRTLVSPVPVHVHSYRGGCQEMRFAPPLPMENNVEWERSPPEWSCGVRLHYFSQIWVIAGRNWTHYVWTHREEVMSKLPFALTITYTFQHPSLCHAEEQQYYSSGKVFFNPVREGMTRCRIHHPENKGMSTLRKHSYSTVLENGSFQNSIMSKSAWIPPVCLPTSSVTTYFRKKKQIK